MFGAQGSERLWILHSQLGTIKVPEVIVLVEIIMTFVLVNREHALPRNLPT